MVHWYNVITDQSVSVSGQVDRVSATETVDSGSIPSWVKPKTKGPFTVSWPRQLE